MLGSLACLLFYTTDTGLRVSCRPSIYSVTASSHPFLSRAANAGHMERGVVIDLGLMFCSCQSHVLIISSNLLIPRMPDNSWYTAVH